MVGASAIAPAVFQRLTTSNPHWNLRGTLVEVSEAAFDGLAVFRPKMLASYTPQMRRFCC